MITHEHFHVWNKDYLKDAGDKQEGYYKQLSEEFTDYYLLLTLYRKGIMGGETFTPQINQILLKYQPNPIALSAMSQVLCKSSECLLKFTFKEQNSSRFFLSLLLRNGVSEKLNITPRRLTQQIEASVTQFGYKIDKLLEFNEFDTEHWLWEEIEGLVYFMREIDASQLRNENH